MVQVYKALSSEIYFTRMFEMTQFRYANVKMSLNFKIPKMMKTQFKKSNFTIASNTIHRSIIVLRLKSVDDVNTFQTFMVRELVYTGLDCTATA